MQSRELTIGRTFGVTFDHGDDFFDTVPDPVTESASVPPFPELTARESEVLDHYRALVRDHGWAVVQVTGLVRPSQVAGLLQSADGLVLPNPASAISTRSVCAGGSATCSRAADYFRIYPSPAISALRRS